MKVIDSNESAPKQASTRARTARRVKACRYAPQPAPTLAVNTRARVKTCHPFWERELKPSEAIHICPATMVANEMPMAKAALDPTLLGSRGHKLRAIAFKPMATTDIAIPTAAT